MVTYRFGGSHSAVRTVMTEKGHRRDNPPKRGKLTRAPSDATRSPATRDPCMPDHTLSSLNLPRSRNPRRAPELRLVIIESIIVEVLVEFAEGKRDLSSDQVAAGLALLKKVLPDLANITLPPEEGDMDGRDSTPEFEIHIVDPKA
jgi:hypothetical protein